MKAYDTYVVILCLVVFIALTAMFVALITYIIKTQLKLISGGLCDDKIQKELQQKAKQKNATLRLVLSQSVSIFFCLVVVVIFIMSIAININSNKKVGNSPVIKVVTSSSMATKYEKNTYLDENNITNRIQRFDLISIVKLPSVDELKLFDIVAYESDGVLIVHRIVEIEEPNEEHAERLFKLQGDANQFPDRFPVRYEQMKGLYNGTRVPFLGSFVIFMHSPAGYLCVVLVVFVCIALPLIERKLTSAMKLRLSTLNGATTVSQKKDKRKKLQRKNLQQTKSTKRKRKSKKLKKM